MAVQTAEASAETPKEGASSSAKIEAQGLSKFYGEFAATQDVSFAIQQNEVVAFLGPNGAGKSTTMKMLTGFLAPTHGKAFIGGYDVNEDRLAAAEMLGYLPENGPLYNEMTPHSLLRYCARARGLTGKKMLERLEYVVEQCALKTVWEKPIGKLSKGYRQRVGMAQAILHDPDILILDEPTSGLDPNQTHQARELIRTLGKTKTILLSTHILTEVQAVCSRVLMISAGKLILDGSVDEMSGTIAEMETKFRELTSKTA